MDKSRSKPVDNVDNSVHNFFIAIIYVDNFVSPKNSAA